MGEATAAIVDGVRNVVRNPVIVGVTAAVMVALAPVAAVVGVLGVVLSFFVVGPLVVRLAGALVVKPLLFGGVAGVAAAGFDGSAGVDDYTDSLRGGFLSLVGAYALYEVAVVTVSVGVGVAVIAVLSAGSALGPAAADATEPVSLGVGGVGAVLLAALAVTFQFVDVAAVVGGDGAVEAFRESFRLTRADPLGVAGYSAMRVALVGVVLLPGAVVGFVAASVHPTLAYVGWVVGGLLLPVAFAAVTSAHVAYYRRRRPDR